MTSSPFTIMIRIIGLNICILLTYLAIHRVPRTNGHIRHYHVIFVLCALISTLILPQEFQLAFFSPVSVMMAGTVYPVYESIRAVCTCDNDDEMKWLQYWVVYSTVSYSTEWIDDMNKKSSNNQPTSFQLHWYQFEMFYLLWLLLPYTDVRTLVNEQFIH